MADFKALPDHSRVWVYQADRFFSEAEEAIVEKQLDYFLHGWTAHSKQLVATGLIAFRKFLILMVDEKSEAASGCSIDSSVRMIQDLEVKLACSFFDRLNFVYETPTGELKSIHKDDLAAAYQKQEITDDTLFFDNLISSKADLQHKWRVPLKDSWHKQFI